MTTQSRAATILLVENDSPIRRLIRQVLSRDGHTVIEAADGQEALETAREEHGPIDLLITDIMMPRMDGFTLQAELAHEHPETRVLFLSGHASSEAVQRGLDQAGQAFLLKPFTRSDFIGVVQGLLSETDDDQPSITPPPAAPPALAPPGWE